MPHYDYEPVDATLVRSTDRAALLQFDEDDGQHWIPWSLIEDNGDTEEGDVWYIADFKLEELGYY